VRCGCQEALASKASQQFSQVLQLRIGINLGDITIGDEGDVALRSTLLMRVKARTTSPQVAMLAGACRGLFA
jgi:class 3 adenylate cyclase